MWKEKTVNEEKKKHSFFKTQDKEKKTKKREEKRNGKKHPGKKEIFGKKKNCKWEENSLENNHFSKPKGLKKCKKGDKGKFCKRIRG